VTKTFRLKKLKMTIVGRRRFGPDGAAEVSAGRSGNL
jgi:hypothetical protein